MTLKASIVTEACLPSILAVLMHLKLVPRGAVDYLQNIQVARPVGLPSALATLPSGIKGNSTARSAFESIELFEGELVYIFSHTIYIASLVPLSYVVHHQRLGAGVRADGCKSLIARSLPDEATSWTSLPLNGKRVKFQVGDWHRPNPRGETSSTDDCGVVG